MMVPLPQTGHGCPTKVSALPVAGAEAGAEGIEAGDGEDAIEKYKIYSPDLVIMDITMPKMDGITAVGRIKEIDDNAKIIMCSSMGYQEKVLDAITAGAKDFIIKPYEAAKVAKSIKAVLKLGEE